jgi:hypothetical protein
MTQALAPVPLCPQHNERMKVSAALDGYSCSQASRQFRFIR